MRNATPLLSRVMDANSVAGLVSGVHFCSLMRYCVVTGSYGHELWPTVKPYSWGRAMLSIGCEQFAPRNSVVPPCTLCFSGSQGPRSSDGNKKFRLHQPSTSNAIATVTGKIHRKRDSNSDCPAVVHAPTG